MRVLIFLVISLLFELLLSFPLLVPALDLVTHPLDRSDDAFDTSREDNDKTEEDLCHEKAGRDITHRESCLRIGHEVCVDRQKYGLN